MNSRRVKRYVDVGVTLLIILLGVNACFGPPKFWRNHVGWRERDVIASLGKPRLDSRVYDPDYKPGQSYTLLWYHGYFSWLDLYFNANGVVVKQRSGSK